MVGSVTVSKAVACWRMADAAVDGAFCLAARLFASVEASNFLPLPLLWACDSDADSATAVSVESGSASAGPSVSLTVFFFGFDFLGFGVDGCSIATTSSGGLEALFDLPRFFTVSVDMMAQQGGLGKQ